MNHNFIGLDLGSKTSISCHLKGQVSNIILNDIGGRETPVCISYSQQQRLFGQQAVVTTRSRPLATILSPQRFITSNPEQIGIQKSYSLAKFENNCFHVEGQNLKLEVTPQQVLTGYINYVQSLTKDIPKTAPFVYTISVPNHCGYNTRRQILKCGAAILPSPPSIVSEKMAVGLDYLINTSKEIQNVLFIDFGHSKLTAYVLKFTEDSIEQVIEMSNHNLGVRCIDAQLIQYLQSIIKFKLNQKHKLKIRDIAIKTRTILSANTQHIINEDFGDNDFECKITRQDFEKIGSTIFNQVQEFLKTLKTILIQKAIKLDKMQVFGGGSRIPLFQQILSSIFTLQIRKAINNEAISRGCALYAHHKQKISKLAKIQLKQIVKSKVNLIFNHYQKSAVGPIFDQSKIQNIQTHTLYEAGEFNIDRNVSIERKPDHSLQIWLITNETQPLIQYYNIGYDQINNQIVNLNFDFSWADGFPRLRSINGQLKNPQLTRIVPFSQCYKSQIDSLRTRQLQFRSVDLKILQLQQKRNKVQSQVFRVRDKHPQAQKYLQGIQTKRIEQLDIIINALSELK